MSNPFSLEDTRIVKYEDIPKPKVIKSSLTPSISTQANIIAYRQTISNIMNGFDNRRLMIVGPCSIHDTEAALDYAYTLATLHKEYANKIFIIMRVYFEKPRTQIGWKGFINDPRLDGSHKMYEGIFKARELLIKISETGLPIATEWLDTITPQYIADLISVGMIGARTTESQVHRQLVSGLSMPVGFKNTTSGNIQIACDAIKASNHPQSFLGTNDAGDISLVRTKGNLDTFIVLRGSCHSGPNYDPDSIAKALTIARGNGINPAIIVDCSHGNSQKDYRNQELVCRSISHQIANGNKDIKGVMLESNIHAGSQRLDLNNLRYGVSITDGCIDLPTTKIIIKNFVDNLPSQVA